MEVEPWDDVGGYLASAPAEAHMFVGSWFLRLARLRNMNVSFLQSTAGHPRRQGPVANRAGYCIRRAEEDVG